MLYERKVKKLYIIINGLNWQPKELPLAIDVESIEYLFIRSHLLS